MNLAEIPTGQSAIIVKVSGHGSFRRRLLEMGFVKGKVVRVVQNAPLRDPIEYEIMGYMISLRREEARLVEVITEAEAVSAEVSPCPAQSALSIDSADEGEQAALLTRRMRRMAADKHRIIRVALVGNPNCGKTTLFNAVTGDHQHVGNYSGVTVDATEGSFTFTCASTCVKSHVSCAASCGQCAHNSPCDSVTYQIKIVDLPGTYSLSAYSPEERYVRRHLTEEMPDVILNVVDATNLARNLYLTTQLIDMDQRMVMALNMADQLEKQGDLLDVQSLGVLLGVPIVPTSARTGEGVQRLFSTVVAVYEQLIDRGNQLESTSPIARHIHINHGAVLEQSIERLRTIFRQSAEVAAKYSTRYLAITFLEGDPDTQALVETLPTHDHLIATRYEETVRIKQELRETPDNALTDAKYGFIEGALRETFQQRSAEMKRTTLTQRLDAIFIHRVMGIPLFFFLLFLVFYATFALGEYPMLLIERAVQCLADFVSYVMPAGMLRDMLVDGAISGVGAVISFLPNILLLYFFISILEDSGYMARAAFIMDRIMHLMGLHGKSFIPMVMGFGCNVPAVMATRTIENPKSRLITMLVIPFMSCAARIPIYVVIAGAFFGQQAAYVLFGLYALGILTAVISARLFGRTFMRDADYPFVMELPPYRMPSASSVLRHTWEKGRQYLRKMAGIILIFSLLVWVLGYFPQNDIRQHVEQSPSTTTTTTVASSTPSYLQQIGQHLAPVFAPMGFDWQMSVSLVAGLGAKELIVSSLAVMDADASATSASLTTELQSRITPSVALAFLVFVLLYFPCIATLAAIRQESKSVLLTLFIAAYTTIIAYLLSFLTYQVCQLFCS